MKRISYFILFQLFSSFCIAQSLTKVINRNDTLSDTIKNFKKHSKQKKGQIKISIAPEENGSFSLKYDLGEFPMIPAEVKLFDGSTELIGEYTLPDSAGGIIIHNSNLKHGTWIYEVYINSKLAKTGELYIIALSKKYPRGSNH